VDPKEAWDILERLHASKGFQRKVNLSQKPNGLQKSSTTSLTDHENDFRDILEEMSAVSKIIEVKSLSSYIYDRSRMNINTLQACWKCPLKG
jgi:gag-polypeptide of LTR copia-type